MGHNRAIDALAARQHGVISRSQALRGGLSPSQIRRGLESEIWTALDISVYAAVSAPATWKRQLAAAILSRPSAIVAGRSAARLHGFSGFVKSRPEIPLPFTGNARSPIARVIRSRHFDLIDTKRVEGFECTTPAETLLTLCYSLPPNSIERLIDDQLARKLLAIGDFDPIFARLTNVPIRRIGTLRRIVTARDSNGYQPPMSELERRLYRLLDHAEIPNCTRQLPISYPDTSAIVDAYIPEWNLIVEADGRRWHTREADFERDRLRDNAAAAAGLIVVRFSYRMLTSQPEKCLQTLLSVGTHRAA